MKLKELRETKTNKNQTQLAQDLSIPRVTYNKYELGDVEPNIATLKKLAKYYKVSLDYLCDFEPDYLLTLPSLNEPQKKAIKILINLPIEVFYYMLGKLETYKEQYQIQI